MQHAQTSPTNAGDPANLPKDPHELRMYRALEKRLVLRTSTDGVVYTLDLRQKRFSALKSPRLTVRSRREGGKPQHLPMRSYVGTHQDRDVREYRRRWRSGHVGIV